MKRVRHKLLFSMVVAWMTRSPRALRGSRWQLFMLIILNTMKRYMRKVAIVHSRVCWLSCQIVKSTEIAARCEHVYCSQSRCLFEVQLEVEQS